LEEKAYQEFVEGVTRSNVLAGDEPIFARLDVRFSSTGRLCYEVHSRRAAKDKDTLTAARKQKIFPWPALN
jgi:hypothetical protein